MITVILYFSNAANSQHSSSSYLFLGKYMMVYMKPAKTISPQMYMMWALLVRCWLYAASTVSTGIETPVALLLVVGSKNNNTYLRNRL